jgi:PhnB protein
MMTDLRSDGSSDMGTDMGTDLGAEARGDFALALFVELGRELEAASFYAEAFGAERGEVHRVDGVPTSVEMRIGGMLIHVAGVDPARMPAPERGGPFFPKAPGAVSTIFHLGVDNVGTAVGQAIAAGATLRDPVQNDLYGRRVASLFDPFGHVWALVARERAGSRRAA